MGLKNCSKCGRMFAGEDFIKLCEKCRDNDEETFKIVREYIYDNPSSTVVDVSEATGVDEEKILKFLRQGKLVLKGDGVGLECERCGASISSGRFCDKCTHEMAQGFKKAFGQEEKPAAAAPAKKSSGPTEGMHIKVRK